MSPADSGAYSILVVDDNEDNREVLSARLGHLGYRRIRTADGGRQALRLIEQERFDLMLLDVMMPDMSGIEVLESLRSSRRLLGLPVIIVSAAADLENVVRCIELGAEDYLVKPVNPTLLRARVGATLEKQSLRDRSRLRLEELGHELAAARELQRGMVPIDLDGPASPVSIHILLEPARELGGDLCDFLVGADDSIWFGLGDVSGKGVAAAIFMARTWSVLRSIAGRPPRATLEESEPGRVLAATNRELCKANETSMFSSVFLGRVHLASGLVEFANAGHLHPYHVATDGSVTAIASPPAMPVGAMPDTNYQSGSFVLPEGDLLFVYSDGITEAADAGGDRYGEPRLERDLGELATLPGRQLLETVLERVRRFCGPMPQTDDLTALVLRRKAPPA